MASPIKIGAAYLFLADLPCTDVSTPLLEAECCYYLHLLPITIWKPPHSQNARCILSILRHFIMLRMLRHWEDCNDWLTTEKKKKSI